jgi:NADH:ubiquinone oxidoreductase subunit 6 (subunit J)
MAHQPKDYETAKRSLRHKMVPGVVILIILAICIFLMIVRKDAPVPPTSTRPPAATH